MDQPLNIYANVERPSGNASTKRRETHSCENIYENVLIHSLEPNRTGPALSGADNVKKRSCRAAAVFLGLLCLLLLTALTILVVIHTKSNSEREMETALLQSSYNNLTEERDQLKNSYYNLISEKHQVENSLTRQKDQLQTRYNQLSTEKKQLQQRFDALTKARNDLQRKLQAQTAQRISLEGVKSQQQPAGET